MKFSLKLILLFGILILVLGTSFSYYIYVESRNTLEKEITSRLEEQAFSTMNKIDMVLFERYSDIKVIANLPRIRAKDLTPEDKTNILLIFRNFRKGYASLSFFDINRTRIADTSGLKIGEQHAMVKYWEDVLNGEVSAGSDTRVAEELGIPIIYFASPVKDNNGKTFGAVVARMPLSKLYDVLLSGETKEKVEKDEEIDLVDANGVFLYSTHNKAGMLTDKIPFWDKIKEVSKNSNQGSFSYNLEGEDNLVVFVKEQGYLDFEGNDWILIMHLPVKQAFAPVYTVMYKLGMILAGLLMVFSVVIIYISRKMLKPLAQLSSATQELGKRNFKARTNIKTGDEFEEVGNSFNKTLEQLEKIDEERKQIDKAKTEFLSITSHELRSPMTPMKAQLQMLTGGYFGKLKTKQNDAVDLVLRNTERLDKIIQDFLEISRIEAARLKFNFMKTSLSPYIGRVIEEMKGFMPEKKIELELKTEKLPVMEVDPDRVMQVLRNLVNNAIKFSNDDGKIIIVAERKKGLIQFSVKDGGMGITPQDQARIFEPFFQSGGMYARKFGGTGLGLAICKGIVESQNGRIWFESEFGKGTTFYFTIPLIPFKEAKSIRILFSSKQDIEKKIELIFKEILGPLGIIEFEVLRKSSGLIKENLREYIKILAEKGIITTESAEKFNNEVTALFGGKSKEEIAEDIFVEMLGPLGKKRFEKLDEVTEESILQQIKFLKQKGILNRRESEEFKNKIRLTFEEKGETEGLVKKPSLLSEADLAKEGLIK